MVVVDKNNPWPKYDMIISKDLYQRLRMDILWLQGGLLWDGITVPMQSVLTAAKLQWFTDDK